VVSVSEPHRSRTMRFTCVHRILRDLRPGRRAQPVGRHRRDPSRLQVL